MKIPTLRRFAAPALAVMIVFAAAMGAISSQPDTSHIDLNGARLIEEYSNGARKYKLADGSVAVIWKDGATELTLPNETVIQTWPPKGKNSEIRRVTYPNGTRESFYVGGGTKIVRPDGTIIETWEGTGRTEIKRVTRPGGDVESFYADGGRKIVHKDGSEIATGPDGHIREVRADGSVWETSTSHRAFINPDIIELGSYPESVDPGAAITLKWQLRHGFVFPWVSIMVPDGSIRTIPAESIPKQGDDFGLTVKFDAGKGRYKIEIIAIGRYGNEIAANFPVWAGPPSPDNDLQKLYPVADPRTPLDVLEKRFWEMVNETRVKHKVAPLPWDAEIAQISRNHARDMAGNVYFGHISPTQGNMAQRAIKRFGWQSTIWGIPPGPPQGGQANYIAENISRTRSLADAIESLMESPAHRKLLLHPYFTSCGIGMSWGDYNGSQMLYIVTAMMQKNRPNVAPPPPPPPPEQDRRPKGFHIFGLDYDTPR